MGPGAKRVMQEPEKGWVLVEALQCLVEEPAAAVLPTVAR